MKYGIECISCGCGEFENIAVNNEFYTPRDIIRCESCGLAFVHPLPSKDELQRFYKERYSLRYTSYKKKKSAFHLSNLFPEFFLRMRIQERFRHLSEKHISLHGINVLEIGSANGAFLNALKKRGGNVFGVEPSKLESSVSIDRFGITPISSYTEELMPEFKGAYDIIFSYHVLEHLRDPLKELKCIKQLLKDEGYFIGEVPFTPQNVSRLDDAIKKSVFDNLHLFHFNTKSIFNLLKRSNFSDIDIERLELKSLFKKVYPKANVHYLHPSFEKKFIVKVFSLFEAIELGLRSLLGMPSMGAQRLVNLESEWTGPNDWIRFHARA